MTDQQKQNLANILRLAKGYIAANKKAAVQRGDFDASLRIASNEAFVEARFREQGVDLDAAEKTA